MRITNGIVRGLFTCLLLVGTGAFAPPQGIVQRRNLIARNVEPFFGGSDDPEKQAWLTSDDRFSPEWLQSKQYGAGPMSNPSTDSSSTEGQGDAAGGQQQQGNMQDLMQQGTMSQAEMPQQQGNMQDPWGGMQGQGNMYGGMQGGNPYGGMQGNEMYGMQGRQQQGMMGQQQGMPGQQDMMNQQGMSPYANYMPPFGQETDPIFMAQQMYEVQDDVIQRFWDDPVSVRFTGIVARMTYEGNQELLEPKYFFLNVNGTIDLGSGTKSDVTFDGMDRVGLSDRAFVVKKTQDALKLDSFNAKDCNLVRGRDGKVEVIKQGDKDIPIYQGDSIQFKDNPNYSGYERFDILFHNAPPVQTVPIQWDESAMSPLDENDMPTPPMGGPEPEFRRPKVSPLSLARKRALFAISTKIMSLELISDEIQAATNVDTIEELLEVALETGAPVIDIPSSQKLEEEKLGQGVMWEKEVGSEDDEKQSDDTDETEMLDEEDESDDEEEEEQNGQEEQDETEEVKLVEEVEAILSEEQQKIEEAKAQYIREMEARRQANLAEKSQKEASSDEAIITESQDKADEDDDKVVLEPSKDIESEKSDIKVEKVGAGLSMKSVPQEREVAPEIKSEPNPEVDAKKLRRFRELQKKVNDAHRLLRNPPPDPTTNEIKQKQQAARDTIEKAHLTPCFFDTHGGCNDPNCFFLHEKKKGPTAAKSNPNKPVSKTYPKATPIPKISTEVTSQRGVLYEWHAKGKKGAFGYIRLDSGEELYCNQDSFVKQTNELRESMNVKVEKILRCDSRKPGQHDEAKNVRIID